MNFKEILKGLDEVSSNMKQFENPDDIDYYSDRFNVGLKLIKVYGDYFIMLYLDNLPGKHTSIIHWPGTKEEYESMLDFLEDIRITDLVKLIIFLMKMEEK